ADVHPVRHADEAIRAGGQIRTRAADELDPATWLARGPLCSRGRGGVVLLEGPRKNSALTRIDVAGTPLPVDHRAQRRGRHAGGRAAGRRARRLGNVATVRVDD